MTRTTNGKPDLPEGAGPIDTGTPVRGPGAPVSAPRTVTGEEPAGRTGTDPRTASGPAVSETPGHTVPHAGPDAARATAEDGPRPGSPLFAPEEQEAYAARIQQAVTGFVEDPHRAVREADAAFDEVVASLGAALKERRRRLRAGKDGSDPATGAGTEELRIALQHYRDLTERLVRL
ncbi:hypothetical protein PZ61_0234095 [Streptomyces sp. MNU77]|uniref:hypothetical protein n=1 Tax=Streptomyces sp. MNU77 TaxID=1573406 RepID=UPI0005DE18CB|nr:MULTISPECIES: hypothetical protein [unclassified Streptomyces]OLO35038.1 hypothetical protein PZ61_0234095 [Streptomyces sp. MNU77]OWA15192.1 hypothetical protein B9W61_34765 [Streptomyces sp. CS057]